MVVTTTAMAETTPYRCPAPPHLLTNQVQSAASSFIVTWPTLNRSTHVAHDREATQCNCRCSLFPASVQLSVFPFIVRLGRSIMHGGRGCALQCQRTRNLVTPIEVS